jgi:hypothetical protein
LQRNIIQYCSLIATLLCNTELNAQTIENSINLYGTDFPQEKIHIHFDKESYLPGETIWFKAYLLEENLPSNRSTNFYAALYDEKGKMVQQHISPVFNSSTDGHFIVPDSLQSAQLICRAYTTWMLNFDTAMLFTQVIRIINSTTQSGNNETANLHFFPEGGDIIEGVKNTIAFKASYNNGLPFHVAAVIKKQDSDEVAVPLTVLHDGMGKFNLDISRGDKYYAEWTDNNGIKVQTFLPEAKAKGVSLKISLQADKLYFNLVNKTGSDSLHILMYMYQKVFYKTNLSLRDAEPYTGIIPVSSLPSGTMQLTVFDVNWQPVAERVAFINNNNFIINAGLFTKETSLQKRGKNIIEILIADTVPANMSLSISDADLNNAAAENTIISNFLLKADVKGYIHNPAYYFTGNVDALVKAKLDLVMLTNGWRRYNWNNMLVQRMPSVNYPADGYLSVYGRTGKEVMDKLEKDETVNLIIKTTDSSNYFYSILPDKNGIIKHTGLIFYDTAMVYYSFNKNKNLNSQIAFGNSNFTNIQPAYINHYNNYFLHKTETDTFIKSAALYKYYLENIDFKKGRRAITLEPVVVKTRQRKNLRYWNNEGLEAIEKKYATGDFRGFKRDWIGNNNLIYGIDVLHDVTADMSLDIAEYIVKKIPWLMIGHGTYGERFIWDTEDIYIDGVKSDWDDLIKVKLRFIAYIKFFEITPVKTDTAKLGRRGGGLAVYTQKGRDLIERNPTAKDIGLVYVAGYTPIKEFYEPDYALDNTNDTDARTTLLWLPYIFTDIANRKLPIIFYNNDFTKKMRIVLEGINEEGKMIRIEKMIE